MGKISKRAIFGLFALLIAWSVKADITSVISYPIVKSSDTTVSPAVFSFNFGSEFTVTESPEGEVDISLFVPFDIASFSDGNSLTQEIGVGTWKAIGALSFTATYTAGPATSSTVTYSGWSALPMGGTNFQGPTLSVQSVSYPSVAGTVVFTLNSAKGSQSDTATITHTFVNKRFWGVTTVASGFTESDVESLSGSELSNSISKTFNVTAGSSEYIVYAYPSRLGTATFTVGGFEGGFNSPETVSITNASGYTEDYYVYRSVNSALGSTTVTVS